MKLGSQVTSELQLQSWCCTQVGSVQHSARCSLQPRYREDKSYRIATRYQVGVLPFETRGVIHVSHILLCKVNSKQGHGWNNLNAVHMCKIPFCGCDWLCSSYVTSVWRMGSGFDVSERESACMREEDAGISERSKKKKVVVCVTGSSFTRGAQGPICPSRERRVRDEV